MHQSFYSASNLHQHCQLPLLCLHTLVYRCVVGTTLLTFPSTHCADAGFEMIHTMMKPPWRNHGYLPRFQAFLCMNMAVNLSHTCSAQMPDVVVRWVHRRPFHGTIVGCCHTISPNKCCTQHQAPDRQWCLPLGIKCVLSLHPGALLLNKRWLGSTAQQPGIISRDCLSHDCLRILTAYSLGCRLQ